MTPNVTRRTVLAGAGSAAAGAGLARSATAREAVDLSDWFANTSNADAVVDETGADEVTVAVGSGANGGAFGFAPAAVRVDPGATVVWEWTGDGGSHDVVAEDGAFESELAGEAGHTFEWTAESGVHRYACTPHASIGMKGAVVVGDVAVSLGGTATTTTPDDRTTATPTTTAAPDRTFDGWLADANGYGGVVDRRGEDEVGVAVGADAGGGDGAYAFDPAAVHVSPGTTVVWRWVDDGATRTHGVVAEDGAYEGPEAAGAGTTYAVRFDGHGVSKYACPFHGDRGMRGVVVVGYGDTRRTTPLGLAVAAGAGGLAILGLGKLIRDELDRDPPPRPTG